MAAVIQRVVASPQVRIEYLSSLEPEVWGEKKHDAIIFKTHSHADQFAKLMRERLEEARRETGEIVAGFLHARTLENSEWDEIGGQGVWKPETVFGRKAKRRSPITSNGNGVGICVEDPLPEGGPPPKSEIKIPAKIDPKRWAEVLRDPVEAY